MFRCRCRARSSHRVSLHQKLRFEFGRLWKDISNLKSMNLAGEYTAFERWEIMTAMLVKRALCGKLSALLKAIKAVRALADR